MKIGALKTIKTITMLIGFLDIFIVGISFRMLMDNGFSNAWFINLLLWTGFFIFIVHVYNTVNNKIIELTYSEKHKIILDIADSD